MKKIEDVSVGDIVMGESHFKKKVLARIGDLVALSSDEEGKRFSNFTGGWITIEDMILFSYKVVIK